MRIGVDIDGVLGEQVPHVLRRVNARYGLALRKRDIRRWDEPVGPSDIEREIEAALLDETYVLTMPLVRGAREALAALAATHSIALVTTRPEQMDSATLAWAQRKGLAFHGLENARSRGKHDVDVDVLIDDRLQNVAEFAERGRVAILFSQPWNQDREDIQHLMNGRSYPPKAGGMLSSSSEHLASDECGPSATSIKRAPGGNPFV